MPRGGSLPQRGSTGSHQSARGLHRAPGTTSHRRAGSRAEARRASMLSKHTAFSSPMVSPAGQRCHLSVLCPLPVLQKRCGQHNTQLSWARLCPVSQTVRLTPQGRGPATSSPEAGGLGEPPARVTEGSLSCQMRGIKQQSNVTAVKKQSQMRTKSLN